MMLWKKAAGLMRNPVTMKKAGMKKAFPKNSIFSLAGSLWTVALTARPAEEGADNSGQIDGLGDHRRYRQNRKHEDEIGRLVVPHPVQRITSQPAQPHEISGKKMANSMIWTTNPDIATPL